MNRLNRRFFLKTSGALAPASDFLFWAARTFRSPPMRSTTPPGPRSSAGGSACRPGPSTRTPFSRPSTIPPPWASTSSRESPTKKSARSIRSVIINDDSPADVRKMVKKKLADSGVKMVSYGCCTLSKDPAQCRKMFDFAKDMGLETLVSEPDEEAFDTLDKLCEEYANQRRHSRPCQSLALLESRHRAEGLQGPQPAGSGPAATPATGSVRD